MNQADLQAIQVFFAKAFSQDVPMIRIQSFVEEITLKNAIARHKTLLDARRALKMPNSTFYRKLNLYLPKPERPTYAQEHTREDGQGQTTAPPPGAPI